MPPTTPCSPWGTWQEPRGGHCRPQLDPEPVGATDTWEHGQVLQAEQGPGPTRADRGWQAALLKGGDVLVPTGGPDVQAG